MKIRCLQAVLQDALEKKEYWRLKDAHGKPPGVAGWWPSRAVTFLDNHDTGAGCIGARLRGDFVGTYGSWSRHKLPVNCSRHYSRKTTASAA